MKKLINKLKEKLKSVGFGPKMAHSLHFGQNEVNEPFRNLAIQGNRMVF